MMPKKRLLVLYAVLLIMMAVDLGRVYITASNPNYAQNARTQTVTTLTLPPRRGNFYDRNGLHLTGYTPSYYALCVPGESSYARLFEYVSYASQALLYDRRNSAAPFLVPVDADLSGSGLYVYRGVKRYLPAPVAEHLIGYLNGEGSGVSGLEQAFDDVLGSRADTEQVECITTAQGTLMQGETPRYTRTGEAAQGIKLTLDLPLQRACEGIAEKNIPTGCILVLECATGKILASVSVPDFDPDNVAKSIEANDSSLIDRALAQYNVGSVFKPVLAAAALQNGYDWYSYTCQGAVEISDHVYRCAGSVAHGTVNLRGALEQSCNCYFIRLGQHLGGEAILRTSRDFGFGQAVALGGGLKSAPGNLPGAETLENLGQLSGISFGQGQLLASPIQVAGMMNTIANNGIYKTPSLLEGFVNEETGQTVQNLYEPVTRTVLEQDTARFLRDMLVSVVTDGIGKEAQPTMGGAGGKTGTAQTGRFDTDENEKMDYWFAGFYPAQNPQYTVVVLQDDQIEPAVSCASVFAQVCDAIYYLQMADVTVDN